MGGKGYRVAIVLLISMMAMIGCTDEPASDTPADSCEYLARGTLLLSYEQLDAVAYLRTGSDSQCSLENLEVPGSVISRVGSEPSGKATWSLNDGRSIQLSWEPTGERINLLFNTD